MPHGRLVLAAVAYSTTLALSIAILTSLGLFLLYTAMPIGLAASGPTRGLGSMLLATPAALFLSLLGSVPFTYIAWKRRPVSKFDTAKLVGAAAIAPAVPLAYVSMGTTFQSLTIFLTGGLALALVGAFVFGLPAVAWWFAAPPGLTTRSVSNGAPTTVV